MSVKPAPFPSTSLHFEISPALVSSIPNPRSRTRSRFQSRSTMAESDPALPPQPISPLSLLPEERVQPLKERIKDLDESQAELLSRIQGLKQNVQSWRSMVDTQLKSYKDELSGLKSQLETELEQLSSDFKELKTTLQKQQEDVTNSLKNLGLQDIPKTSAESENQNIAAASDDAQQAMSESNDEAKPTGDSSTQ